MTVLDPSVNGVDVNARQSKNQGSNDFYFLKPSLQVAYRAYFMSQEGGIIVPRRGYFIVVSYRLMV